MPLSDDDIGRIRGLGFQKDGFVLKKNGWLQLRNRKGACVFLDRGMCSIYEYRPGGCRFYPLIFDEELESPLLDEGCPYKSEFKVADHASEALFNHIRQLNAERNKRLK
jgi:Fe-S-cluster containining protein